MDVFGGSRTQTSLITVTYNSAETLRRCWGDVALPEGVEWIVVDNASQDGSPSVARELGAKVVQMGVNSGFSAANNAGLDRAAGEFIGFLNPDVRPDLAGLGTLAATALDNGGLVAPQLLNADGTEQPNGRGYPLLSAKVRNRIRGDDTRYLLRSPDDSARPVCWVMGAALFGWRADFERIGGWDPWFFLYYEDKDICLRAWEAGIPTLIVPSVRWQHGWARETSTLRLGPWRREVASMVKFYRRYPEFLLGRRTSARAHPSIESAVFRPAA
jgi:GT2 family glycosyltransferase